MRDVTRRSVLFTVSISQTGLCLLILTMMYLSTEAYTPTFLATTWAALMLSAWSLCQVVTNCQSEGTSLFSQIIRRMWQRLQQMEDLDQAERAVARWLFIGTNLLIIIGAFFNISNGYEAETIYLIIMVAIQLVLVAYVLGPGWAFTLAIFDALLLLSSGFAAGGTFRLELSAIILVCIALSGGIIWFGQVIISELRVNRKSEQQFRALEQALNKKEQTIERLQQQVIEFEGKFIREATISNAVRQGKIIRYNLTLHSESFPARTPYEAFRDAGLFHLAIIEKQSHLRVQLLDYTWGRERSSTGPNCFFWVTQLKKLETVKPEFASRNKVDIISA